MKKWLLNILFFDFELHLTILSNCQISSLSLKFPALFKFVEKKIHMLLNDSKDLSQD